jgi:hypothetical protein
MDAPLEDSIKATFPGNFFSMGRSQWLVAAEGTAREVSDKLKITGVEPPGITSSVVFSVSGYFGRASSEVWEWIAAKLGGHIIA